MLNQRRALLSYLRRTDFEAFAYVIHSLGLRDNAYAKQARGARGGATPASVLAMRQADQGALPQH